MSGDRGLPPGPRWPPVVQSLALLRFRHRFVPALRRRHGPVFTVRTLPRDRRLVLFSGPEEAREIFAGDPDTLHGGEANAILRPVLGDHSLLLTDAAEHARARRLLMPAFNGAALRGYEPMVRSLAVEEVERWAVGDPFRSLDRMSALTLEVILRVVLGVTDEARLARLRPLVDQTVRVGPAVLLGREHPLLRRIGPWRAARETQRALDRVLAAEIGERRWRPARGDDVLSRLLRAEGAEGAAGAGEGGDGGERLGDAELRDHLVTLLLAGHETTATALSWTLFELGRDPAQLARAQRAAREGDTDHLQAVLQESMRLHPVIPMVVRHLTRPARVGAVELPAGVDVGPSILLMHSSARLHRDPGRFRPERFLDGEVAPHTWIPFGGGVRRCIGAGFSLMEGVAVLREVLTRYDVRAVDPGRERPMVRNITSVPRLGARIEVRPVAGPVAGPGVPDGGPAPEPVGPRRDA